MLDPMEEVPEAEISSDSSLEKQRCQEEKMLIISALDHTSEAFTHLNSCCADLSSLTKITDRETLHLVMKATIHPLIQFNVPEKFLNLVKM